MIAGIISFGGQNSVVEQAILMLPKVPGGLMEEFQNQQSCPSSPIIFRLDRREVCILIFGPLRNMESLKETSPAKAVLQLEG
jgi:hypothetical protein